MKLRVEWVREPRPGAQWVALHRRTWPAYHAWFLKEGADRRPDFDTCRLKLREHMPELLPLWEHLIELSGDHEDTGRMLSLYCPTAYLAGCSQAVWTRGQPMLVRNYDYHPDAWEGRVTLTAWDAVRVLGTSDCLWGLLDGMNEFGLVVALSFGGSREVGVGFGIPLILRYALQQCRSVAEASAVFRRVPSHMSYNVSMLDGTGDYAVAMVGPGRPTIISREAVSTNHQRRTGWTEYQRVTRSAERAAYLTNQLASPDHTARSFTELFLLPPLHSTRFDRWSGTLYTAAYRPVDGEVEFLWPEARRRQSFQAFDEQDLVVRLHQGGTTEPS